MRIILALDVDDTDREHADATLDDITDGLAARLTEFYPSGPGWPVRARMVPGACAEVTEAWETLLAAWHVGLEGADDTREGEEAWIALTRFDRRA